MDLITYALLKKQGGSSADINEIKNRLNLLEQEIDEKVAVLDAGLTPVASKKGEVIVNEVTDEVWDRLNNNNADVYAAVDGVVIRATYAVNQDNEVEISEGSRVICTISEDDGEYSIDWNEYYNDADISLTAVGVIGEALWVKGAGTGAIKTVGASVARGEYSTAHGYNTQALGYGSHAEGGGTSASQTYSHAEGGATSASGQNSHAEGGGTSASGEQSHAEGAGTYAQGNGSHAEGSATYSTGAYSHAEGGGTHANSTSSHAEGSGSVANGTYAHAEGGGTQANGNYSHAEGGASRSIGYYSHAEGASQSIGDYSHSEGGGSKANGIYSHAEGNGTKSDGDYSHAEGVGTTSEGFMSHAEGASTKSSGYYSHAEGMGTLASGEGSHAEGTGTTANAYAMHSSGAFNIPATIATAWVASTSYSVDDIVSKGGYTYRCITANSDSSWTSSKWEILHPSDGDTAFVIGNGVDANNPSNAMKVDWDGNLKLAGDVYVNSNANSTGGSQLATKDYVDEHDLWESGNLTGAIKTKYATAVQGSYALAEGHNTTASSSTTHAEGENTTASASYAHSEGYYTTASGITSHAEGHYTIANASYMHASGKYNIQANVATAWVKNTSYAVDDVVAYGGLTYKCLTANSDSTWVQANWERIGISTGDTAFVVGNGANANSRSNAMRLDWDGNLEIAGKMTVGTAPTNDMDVATKKYVDDNAGGGDSYDKADIIITSASGSIASFPDGAKDLPVENLIAEIVPKQNLHGYDNPWPAGGGKNLLNYPNDITPTSPEPPVTLTFNITSTCTFSFKASSDYTNSNNYWLVRLGMHDGTYTYVTPTAGQTVSKTINATSENALESIYIRRSGVTTGKVGNLQLELGSTATSYVPYSNICPITGWDGCEVVRCGKNLFDYDQRTTGAYLDTETGEPVSQSGYYITPFIPVFQGVPVAILGSGTARRWFYDKDKNAKTYLNNSSNQIYTPAEDGYIRVSVSTTSPNALVYQIEYNTQFTAFEPYHGSTYPISWQSTAGTVYGGRLNVTTGELVVDMVSVDLGTLEWALNTSYNIFNSSLPLAKMFGVSRGGLCYCSAYKTVYDDATITWNTFPDKAVSCGNNYSTAAMKNLVIKDTSYNSAASFTLAMSGVQLVYVLATPVVYHLDPTEIMTLLGVNNVWANCGDTEVEYRADTELFVEKRFDIELADYVKNTDYATSSNGGVVKVSGYGLQMLSGEIRISPATSAQVKGGSQTYKPIDPSTQHEATFYGLAKAAGDTTQASSSNAVGTYTAEAKTAIQTMIGVNQWGVGTGTKSIIHAGSGSTATGSYAVSEGYATNANGYASHAEGSGTVSGGNYSHAEGFSSESSGAQSHAEGNFTIANGSNMHSEGTCNIGATVNNNWVANTAYAVGDIAVHTEKTYKCITANTDSVWTASNWEMLYPSTSDTAFIIGNGVDSSNRSNAMKVDWNGNQYLMGDVYVGCDSSSANGMKVATVNEIGGYVVTISDANPVIDAAANTRYVCGEVATLSFTPPQTGDADVRFISGSTATVLTLPNTVKMPSWFTVEANKIYEINIMDGVYGVAVSWNV